MKLNKKKRRNASLKLKENFCPAEFKVIYSPLCSLMQSDTRVTRSEME